MHEVIDLKNVVEYGDYQGLALIHSYDKKLDDSKRPLNGMLHHKGKFLKFKIWDANLQNMFNQNELAGSIVHIIGKAGSYQGVLDITITGVRFDHGFTDFSQFTKSVDIDAVFKAFGGFINTHLTPKAVNVINTVFINENLYERFKLAWAAMKLHDAQVGGLMNHSLKMLNLAKTMIDNDPRLLPFADLIYTGIIFHDVGKIYELDQMGNYTKTSFAGHRTIGVEMLARNKNVFLENFDEHFYYHILEIITGHHGEEHGDKPKTVWAYVIHFIDMIDSQVTGFMDKLENNEVSEYNGNKALRNHGTNLVL